MTMFFFFFFGGGVLALVEEVMFLSSFCWLKKSFLSGSKSNEFLYDFVSDESIIISISISRMYLAFKFI